MMFNEMRVKTFINQSSRYPTERVNNDRMHVHFGVKWNLREWRRVILVNEWNDTPQLGHAYICIYEF